MKLTQKQLQAEHRACFDCDHFIVTPEMSATLRLVTYLLIENRGHENVNIMNQLIQTDPLTFKELRDKCHRHLAEKHTMYCGNRKFIHPDSTWLNDEFSEIRESLVSNKVAYSHTDLKDAFFSVVYEMEYDTIIYPNSAVFISGDLCRVISFRHKYPIEIEFKVFTKGGNGKLKPGNYATVLNEPLRVLFLIDPLTKNGTSK